MHSKNIFHFLSLAICVFAFVLLLTNHVSSESIKKDSEEIAVECQHINLTVINKTDSTCISKGYSGDTVCADCGFLIEKGNSLAKLSHSYSEYQVSVPAKYKKDGKKVKTCKFCGKQAEAIIPMIECVDLNKTAFVYDGSIHKPKVNVFDSKGKRVSSKCYTISYSDGKKLGKHKVKITFTGKYTGTKTLSFKVKLGKVRHIHVLSASKNSLKMTWDPLKGASYYRFEMSKNGSNWEKIKTVKGTSATAKNLKEATKYYFRVTPFDASKKYRGETSNEVVRATLTSAPNISLNNGTDYVTINYSPVNGACKYYIYASLDYQKWWKIAETNKDHYTIKNLTYGKQIYVKACAVNSTSMKSAFSSVKSVVVGMNTPKVGPVKNGNISYENGIYNISDSSTGAKFILVNKSYKLPSSYAPGGLTSSCSQAFSKLCSSAKNYGVSIFSVSGYRSYSYQSGLYQKYVNSYGKNYADLISARPGHSEHQLGLAIDCNSLKRSFAETEAGRWLASHCDDFGFIIRYPKDKTSFTGYSYEPWHIRYLGSVELAHKITDSGLSVEEYYGINSKY